ncbi:class I SAM-dependent DNA methyltransferase [Parasphingorhabdus cellanae]|uniref:Class I SAM-dependent methyltransferase n=1 Tax=Parasphingorhabdus cellanae TaxID=2806553 RepID=A0ABX7T468_9SPHN|nr:class I SAM-dependent methyltransferase [Parasphingorhabdus cellanae]QTD55610.1 class I SAM-dependent methyltransferase [Parasphingorhabdus cellanae]
MMGENIDPIELAKRTTKDVYERQARHWDEIRSNALHEKPWLDRFASALPASGRLLDLGCGSGIPVAGYFLEKGYDLVGVDYSPTMIDLARQHFPQAQWKVQDITKLKLNGQFDGIYSWDGFFHLSVAQQRDVIPSLCQSTKSGGSIMLTIGTGEGEVTGTVGGETVYHASLDPKEYKELFKEYGFADVQYVSKDPESLGRSVLLASGKRAQIYPVL